MKSIVDRSLLVGASFASLLTVCALWSFSDPGANVTEHRVSSPKDCMPDVNRGQDLPGETFYDDPTLSYSFGSPVDNWDEKRRQWLKRHPSFADGNRNRVVVVTGSQPPPCENPIGDYLLLRLFKNKVDYCRLHGYDIFYNSAFLHQKMQSVWAKLPPVRAAMLAHPEAEWIWWLDSDAVITDMEFKLPFKKYREHNLIINGWEEMIYKKKSWLGLNTGIFLIRNCQWSMDIIEAWASMSPIGPNHKHLTDIIVSKLTDKVSTSIDEQSSLVYVMLTEKEKWWDKVYAENEYSLSGYWLGIVDRLAYISDRYLAVEKEASGLRRRRAEVVSERYGELREPYLEGTSDGNGGWRRPFITHFTGCQPCSGHYDPSYTALACWKGMEKALNFADNQVLRNYGFVHSDLLNSSFVSPVRFDSPA